MTDVFDITDLKPESLHAVINAAALLSNVGEAMGRNLAKPDLQQELLKKGPLCVVSALFGIDALLMARMCSATRGFQTGVCKR